jgi:hypothetical protein
MKGYTRPAFEVAQIIDKYRHGLEDRGKLTSHQKKVFTNLQQCRTAALGYHKNKCDNPDCSYEHISFNSCRDRHCPKCNGLRREKWVRMRTRDLLPVKYYHVVFTVPDSLHRLFLEQPVLMQNLLFASAWQTIRQFGTDHKHLGAKMGMIAVLHTWGQNLSFHPHVHCLVPAGGITPQGCWRNTRSEGKYLFPVKSMSKVFRGKLTDGLIRLHESGRIQMDTPFISGKKYIHPLYRKKWVVYAKLPMHNAQQVVEYIGRYTHRIAISNHRIKAMENDRVKFSAKDYRTSRVVELDLDAVEFLRRFALHILPSGFIKIRHYGILSPRLKSAALESVREPLHAEEPEVLETGSFSVYEWLAKLYGLDAGVCPQCKTGRMRLIAVTYPKSRGSPQDGLSENSCFAA